MSHKFINIPVPPKVAELLSKIEAVCPQFFVVLGGGYLRDTYTGRTPKDLDIFLVPRFNPETHTEHLSSNGLTPEWQEVVYDNLKKANMIDSDALMLTGECPAEYVEGMANRGLLWIFMGYSKDCDMEAQVILYDHQMDAEALAHDFDFTINQVARLTNGKVICSDEFITDHANKRLVNTNKDDEQRCKDRLARMIAKFPDYEVVA